LQTDVFRRTGIPRRWDRYFSIVTEDRTLDLEAETPASAEFLASRLMLMIIDIQKNMKWMGRYYDMKSRIQKKKKEAANKFNNTASDKKDSV